jgi:hypothetical protein
LSKREIKVLLTFLHYGPGVRVDSRKIKGCGPTIEECLQARGFIDIFKKDRFNDYALTQAGHEAALKASG